MVNKKPDATKKFYSVREFAELLGVTRGAINKKIRRGAIKAIKVGRNYIIPNDSAVEFTTEAFSDKLKSQIGSAVSLVLKEYGETLRLLGKE